MKQSQVDNIVNDYVQICTTLKNLVAQVRGVRTQVDALGLNYPQVAGAMVWPNPANSQVISVEQWLLMLQAWEHLFGCFNETVSVTMDPGSPGDPNADPPVPAVPPTVVTTYAASAIYGVIP